MARALARKQATVILACRNKDKGQAAERQIAQEYPGAKAELGLLDLSILALGTPLCRRVHPPL